MRYNRFPGLVCCLAGLLGANAVQAAQEKGDVYFGEIKSVDTVNRVVSIDMININRNEKAKGIRSFFVAPDANIVIERPDGRFDKNMTIYNVAVSRWAWIASFDGETTRDMSASGLTSYRGTLLEVQGNTIQLQLKERRRGARRDAISSKEKPRSFEIPENIVCRYKGKQIPPSLIGLGTYLEVTRQEKGGVVLVTVLDE